jgi:hypothetical protein
MEKCGQNSNKMCMDNVDNSLGKAMSNRKFTHILLKKTRRNNNYLHLGMQMFWLKFEQSASRMS